MWIYRVIIIAVLIFHVEDRPVERIVGGEQVDIADFPYQLSVRVLERHICGGALISSQYGLSAAHCFPKSQVLYSVRAGSDQKDSGGVTMGVKTVYLHPERASHPFHYDIAIMEFVKPLTLSKTIQPVKLSTPNDPFSVGMNGVISGFGDTFTRQNKGSTKLRAASISVMDQESCQADYYRDHISLNKMMFCAGTVDGGKDSCQGDSGGPFVMNDVLFGLVSFGVDCGDPRHPGVYTNVAAYREFIKLNTGI